MGESESSADLLDALERRLDELDVLASMYPSEIELQSPEAVEEGRKAVDAKDFSLLPPSLRVLRFSMRLDLDGEVCPK